jgi:hypothetical protein
MKKQKLLSLMAVAGLSFTVTSASAMGKEDFAGLNRGIMLTNTSNHVLNVGVVPNYKKGCRVALEGVSYGRNNELEPGESKTFEVSVNENCMTKAHTIGFDLDGDRKVDTRMISWGARTGKTYHMGKGLKVTLLRAKSGEQDTMFKAYQARPVSFPASARIIK